MNAEVLLQVFLPYHDSTNFARILAILTLPNTSVYHAPFAALAKKAQSVPREYIVSAISSARDPSLQLLTNVAGSVAAALDEDVVHRALLAFWSASLVDLLERYKTTGRVPEGVVKILVEAFVTLTSRHAAGPEVNAAVYPPLVLLARCVRLADAPFAAVVEALVTPGTGANPSQRILTLLVLLDPRKGWEGLGEGAPAALAKVPQLGELLVAAMQKYGFENAVSVIVAALAEDVNFSKAALTTLVDANLPPSIVTLLADKLLSTPAEGHATARALLSTLRQRHPSLVDSAVVASEADPALVQWTSEESAFVDVHSADVSSRVSGVKEMYAVAEAAGLTAENAKELLEDDKVRSAQLAVLSRLRDTEEPVLAALYAKPALLAALLTGTDYVEAVTAAFTAAKPNPTILSLHLGFIAKHIADATVGPRLILPNLLATEERRAFGAEQWALASKASKLVEKVVYDEDAAKFNAGAIKALADAIAACGDIGAQVNVLVRSLSSPLPATRLAATLTLAQLVSTPGGYQAVVAARSLDTLETYLAGKPLRDVHEVETPMSPALMKAVTSRPANSKTQQRAYLALLTAATGVAAVPAFLGEGPTVAHSLYRWANSANLADKVSKHLLQAVFGQLGEEVLVFLASVWSTAADSALRVAALRHAVAFVKAYANKPTDFQLIIPATLIALQDSARAVRQAAAALFKAITPGAPSVDIYALENIYGARSDLAQLLKPADLAKYLDTIKAEIDDMIVDAGRLALVHAKALDAKKKDTHRLDVVDWLMSHVLAWRQLSARRALLSSLDRTTNVSRLHGALALLDDAEAEWLDTLPLADKAEYLDLVFDAFAPKHAAAVTEDDSDIWAWLLKVVATPSDLRKLSLARMESLFAALKPAQKAEYVVALIHSLHGLSTDDKLASKATLAKLTLAAPEVISVLATLLEPLDSPVHRKKAKVDDDDRTEAAVADLTVFVESRDWKMKGNASVVASLMGVLSAVLSKRQAIKEGVDYLEQEVLGGILAQLEQIKDAEAIHRAHIGLEVVVKVIRVSSNPRTSQRALLVAAELARLVPDAVLHNVMPIFTFMGSSDLQRDDAFSFGVVEKTIASIVPVMAASLKDKAVTHVELYTEAKAFLSIFTDMASRLPKHRTLPFFVHLIKSLGDEFLPPVAMLLADRKKAELALSLATAFPPAVRAETLLETVLEAKRDEETSFLDTPNPTVLFQLAAAIAKSLQGKVAPQPVVLSVVSELVESIDENAEATLTAAMQLLSVDSFLEITATVLERDGDDVARTLELFAARLPLIKPELRANAKAAMGTIIKRTAALLQGPKASYALTALDRVVATSVPNEVAALTGIVPTVVAAAKGNPAALPLLAALVRRLGPRAIPFIQSVLDTCLAISRAPPTPEATHAAFDTIAALVDTVPTFINSKQLLVLLGVAAAHRATDEGASAHLLGAVAKRIPSKTLVTVIMDLWKTLKGGAQAPTEAFFALLRNALRHADRKALPALTKSLFAFFLDVFDQRDGSTLPEDTLAALETSAIASFLELVTKLSESGFKPLFGRLYDWAVVDPASDKTATARRVVLLRVMDGLLDKFRHLLTPYMATLLPYVDEALDAYAACDATDARLWSLLLAVLAKSMDVDDGAYWTDVGLLKLLPRVVAQLAVEIPGAPASAPDSPPAATLAAMAAATTSETTLKKINNAVLLATRADEPRARMAALRALDAMWERHADELIQFVPETVAEFLAELIEDENAEVELLARKVMTRIEGVTGSLKEYLE
jgi:U3 small nucleolar RNA-associated protein 10